MTSLAEATEEAALVAATQAFYAALAAGDAEAMEKLWSGKPDITCIHPGWPALIGRAQVLDSWRAILASPPRIEFAQPQVFRHGPDWALVLCHEIVGTQVLTATNVYRREAGAWLMVHHQAGPTPLTAEAATPSHRVH